MRLGKTFPNTFSAPAIAHICDSRYTVTTVPKYEACAQWAYYTPQIRITYIIIIQIGPLPNFFLSSCLHSPNQITLPDPARSKFPIFCLSRNFSVIRLGFKRSAIVGKWTVIGRMSSANHDRTIAMRGFSFLANKWIFNERGVCREPLILNLTVRLEVCLTLTKVSQLVRVSNKIPAQHFTYKVSKNCWATRALQSSSRFLELQNVGSYKNRPTASWTHAMKVPWKYLYPVKPPSTLEYFFCAISNL